MGQIFKQITVSGLKAVLPKLRRQVQAGDLRIACTQQGEVIGFLIPLKDIFLISEYGSPGIQSSAEIPLSRFYDRPAESWKNLLMGVDCIYLTFHKRRILAFVSPRFTHCLPLPLLTTTTPHE